MTKKVIGLVLLCAVVIAVFFNSIIPPVQSPDEGNHLRRAYVLARGQLILDNGSPNIGGPIDVNLSKYIRLFDGVESTRKLNSTTVNVISPSIKWANEEKYEAIYGAGYYFPAIYVPSALGLAVGKAFDINISSSYALARIFTFITVLLLLMYAFSLVRPNAFVIGVLLVPMSLFQLFSATIDSLSMALSILAISCFVKLMRDDQVGSANRKLIIIMCVAIFVVASSRAHSLPLLLMPVVLAWVLRSRMAWCYAILTVVAAVAWTIIALKITVYPPDARWTGRVESNSEVVVYYLTHPLELLSILASTARSNSAWYIATFIGYLGYLDVVLPRNYYYFAGLVLLFLAVMSAGKSTYLNREKLCRIILLTISVSSIFLVFFAMLVTWSLFPAKVIEGVQGRYFHIPIIVFGYALSNFSKNTYPVRARVATAVLALFLVVNVQVMSKALLSWYWLPDAGFQLEERPQNEPLVPMLISAGNLLTGSFSVPRNASIPVVGIRLGTFRGASDGSMSIEVCGESCTSASVEIKNAVDNEIATFALTPEVRVKRDEKIRFKIVTQSTVPVAIWAFPSQGRKSDIYLNGQPSNLVPDMRIDFR